MYLKYMLIIYSHLYHCEKRAVLKIGTDYAFEQYVYYLIRNCRPTTPVFRPLWCGISWLLFSEENPCGYSAVMNPSRPLLSLSVLWCISGEINAATVDLPPLKLEEKLALCLMHVNGERYLIFCSSRQNKKYRERIFKGMK